MINAWLSCATVLLIQIRTNNQPKSREGQRPKRQLRTCSKHVFPNNSQGHMMLKIPQKENENLWYTKEEILMQYHFWILTLHFASLQSLDKVAKKQNLVWPEDKSNHWDFTWIRLLGLWSEPEKVQNYFHLPQISSPSTNNSFSSIGVSRLSSWPEEGLTFKG